MRNFLNIFCSSKEYYDLIKKYFIEEYKMLSKKMFINLSLQLDLFFVRTMKEHSFFLEDF